MTVELTSRLCARCEYNLRGLSENRCPECGLEFDPSSPPGLHIWAQRREHGRLRSFYRTVVDILFHPRRLARISAIWWGLNMDEALAFRRTAILIATGSVLASVLISVVMSIALVDVFSISQLGVRLAGGIIFVSASYLFFRIGSMPFSTAPFHEQSLPYERRVLALHCLCCAGFGFAPIVPLVFATEIAISSRLDLTPPVVLGVFGAWFLGYINYYFFLARLSWDRIIAHLFVTWMLFAFAVLLIVTAIGLIAIFMR